MKPMEWIVSPPDRDPGIFQGGMRYLVDGKIHEWKGASFEVKSPIFQPSGGKLERRSLGHCALLDRETGMAALKAASRAYDRGRGAWPTSSVATRIRCITNFLDRMEKKRLDVARLITWEVGKPWADSVKEFDRTVAYGRDTVAALKELDRAGSRFVLDAGFLAQVRRSPYGVALCMGPYNYPLNEAYTTLLPTLIMGNTVIAKLPRLGMLCNMPILEAFAESFPPGVINIITGEGPTVVTPIVESGEVDLLAFIGSAGVANVLKHAHPRPNRLRSVLGLGAKNPGIILADADLDLTVKECVQGSLTFNGQRCTALKIIFVERKIADEFVARFSKAVAALKSGMPFEDGVWLTPLPEDRMVEKMKKYTDEALANGARVTNPDGGATDRTYFHPAVLYPVNAKMKVWHEEQFGPVVAVAPFDDVIEVLDYVAASPYGQQASVFGRDPKVVGRLVDALVNQVSRVNLNSQCQRGPDTFPFGGRKDSAEGTLSVSDALKVFSTRTLAAAKQTAEITDVIQAIIRGRHSEFLNTDYLF